MTTNAILAIKNKIATMTETEKQAFTKETGIDVKDIYIMSYEAAEAYCKNHNIDLSNVSVFNNAKPQNTKDMMMQAHLDKLDKNNAISEQLINYYKYLGTILDKAKNTFSQTSSDVNRKYNVNTSGEFRQIKDAGIVANTDTSKVTEAENAKNTAQLNYDTALSSALDFTHDINNFT